MSRKSSRRTQDADIVITNDIRDAEEFPDRIVIDLRDVKITNENVGQVVDGALWKAFLQTERGQELMANFQRTGSVEDEAKLIVSFHAYKMVMTESVSNVDKRNK